jgi:hypothetical protein
VDSTLTTVVVLAEESLNRGRRASVSMTVNYFSMESLKADSSIVIAVVLDLPMTVQPPMARGERGRGEGG